LLLLLLEFVVVLRVGARVFLLVFDWLECSWVVCGAVVLARRSMFVVW
jgi:hypothetical protein